MRSLTIGVLALQGGVVEHLFLLRKAIAAAPDLASAASFSFIEVRTPEQLALCDALIIPGGESTTMAIVARSNGLMDPLKDFVKIQRKPVWGTCAGLVMLAEQASATKKGGQELIGGLDVGVLRNRYGTQIQSFVADLNLDFLGNKDETPAPFPGVFIRAPVVERILTPSGDADGKVVKSSSGGVGVEVLGVYRKPGAAAAAAKETSGDEGGGEGEGDIVAVKQGNVFGTSFHPELTQDVRIHVWWLRQMISALGVTPE